MTKRNVFLVLIIFTLSNCASIVSKSTYPIIIRSSPKEAKVQVKDYQGKLVYQGRTPAVVPLSSGAKYFKKNQYTLTFEKEGYDPFTTTLYCKVDGWYFGNFIFGGLLGLLIVDPATGAMYKFKDDTIQADMSENKTASNKGLEIIDINDLSSQRKNDLIKLN